MRRFEACISGVPLEVLQEKREVGLELHLFLRSGVLEVESVWLIKDGAEL
jgi:hypothetical protein